MHAQPTLADQMSMAENGRPQPSVNLGRGFSVPEPTNDCGLNWSMQPTSATRPTIGNAEAHANSV